MGWFNARVVIIGLGVAGVDTFCGSTVYTIGTWVEVDELLMLDIVTRVKADRLLMSDIAIRCWYYSKYSIFIIIVVEVNTLGTENR